MSKPVAAEELRHMFMHTLAAYAHYWAALPGKTPLEQCNGLAFSVLAMIDGSNMGLPSFDLVARPHPDDKAFKQAAGSDWIEDGTAITDTMLHEMWRDYEHSDPDAGKQPAPQKPIRLDIVEWEGQIRCVYLDDSRIAGGKPWGGGRIIASFEVDRSDLFRVLGRKPGV